MPVDPAAVAHRLAASAEAIRALASAVPPEEARRRPEPDRWSVLEVVCHLADEEREDFRQRLDLTLNHPGEPWPAIDPEGWVASRRYAERDPREALDDFLWERARSLEWLRGLGEVDAERAYEHPRAGRITAGDLLASWAAHDLLHVRQLARLEWRRLGREAAPARVEYAGDW